MIGGRPQGAPLRGRATPPREGAARTIVVAVHEPLLDEISSASAQTKLRGLADRIVTPGRQDPWSVEELIEHLDDRVEGLVTSWGSPLIGPAVLAAAPRLAIVGHAAGTVKRLIDPAVWRAGIRVTHAAAALAEAVAEYTLTTILTSLRRIVQYNRQLHADGAWGDELPSQMSRSLRGKRVGLVGASRVGVRVIPLLRPFTDDIVVYDPYLSGQRARELGVRKLELHELLTSSDVVSLHAPILPETRHMIGAEQLALMPEGALLVNSARAWLVDQQALLEALRAGRIDAVLDVFDEEPLPASSPLRSLPNVILTPHVAGVAREPRAHQLEMIADEFERFFRGRPLRHEIRAPDLDRIA